MLKETRKHDIPATTPEERLRAFVARAREGYQPNRFYSLKRDRYGRTYDERNYDAVLVLSDIEELLARLDTGKETR